MRYPAWVAIAPEQRSNCFVSDVSRTGARIEATDTTMVPDSFVLMLSSNGAPRRFCRVIWRKPNQVGVKFERSLAEAAKPLSVIDTDAAPPPIEAEELENSA